MTRKKLAVAAFALASVIGGAQPSQAAGRAIARAVIAAMFQGAMEGAMQSRQAEARLAPPRVIYAGRTTQAGREPAWPGRPHQSGVPIYNMP